MGAERSWGFEPGDEIAPGRSVVRAIGGGRRYEVFLVWDDLMFALVVAKVLRPHVAAEERYRDEIREEAEALARLAHPVIVRGFDSVVDGPHPHVLIEHLEGPTLRQLIRRGGPSPLEQVLPLAAHVAAAVHYMGQKGMVHLDVKPENIVMGVPPRLIDLSIARTVEEAARVRHPLGTDAYMPPEQCAPAEYPGAIGPASDVWGLGATLHHAVAGAVPFPRPRGASESTDPQVRFPQLGAEPQALPESAPAALRDLIASTLARSPADRPSAAELVMGLEPLVGDLPRKLVFGRRSSRFR